LSLTTSGLHIVRLFGTFVKGLPFVRIWPERLFSNPLYHLHPAFFPSFFFLCSPLSILFALTSPRSSCYFRMSIAFLRSFCLHLICPFFPSSSRAKFFKRSKLLPVFSFPAFPTTKFPPNQRGALFEPRLTVRVGSGIFFPLCLLLFR